MAVFFVLLGYVNSLKAVSQARAGATEDALQTIASSTFKRTSRLVLPAAAVTTIAWLACQLGLFGLASKSDAYWLNVNSAQPSDSWGNAVQNLLEQIFGTWLYAENLYDQPQWALFYLFEGSMYVFIALLATIRTTPRFRFFAEAFLYFWSWCTGDCMLPPIHCSLTTLTISDLVGFNVFAGMMIAELSMTQLLTTKTRILTYTPYITFVLALILLSYPNEYADWATWSRTLLHLGQRMTPPGKDLGRFWPGLGAQLLCTSILLSPPLRHAFSHDILLWLGNLSYPLYLLHGTFMRSVLATMTFFPVWLHFSPRNEKGDPDPKQLIPLPRPLAFVLILPLFWTFLLWVVQQWAKNVEPVFAEATKRFEDFAYGHKERERSPSLLPLQLPLQNGGVDARPE